MTPDPRYRVPTCTEGLSDLEALVASMLPRLLRAELERQGARLGREWISQRDAAQLAGVAPKSIRSWQAKGLLTKGRRARVNLAELRKLLAGGGAEGHQLPRLDVARRQQAAAEDILQRLTGEGAAR